MISADELEHRRRMNGNFPVPDHLRKLYRSTVGQYATSVWIDLASRYIDVSARHGNPRHSH